MKKLRLFLLTLVALVGINASAKTVYLKPNANWLTDNARFALYMYGGIDGDEWTDFALVDADNNIYKATFNDSRTNMIFARMNPVTTENNWDNKWNQSGDLSAPTADNQLFTLSDGWDSPSVTITDNYTEPVPDTSYKVDFNTEISTSSHDFAVAPKWKHIVQDNDGYYVNYKWDAAYGTGNPATGGLFVGKQKVGSSYYYESTVYDLLVTPKVSGTIKLKVKVYENASSSTKAFVQLWSVNGAATEKDTQLKEFQTEITGYNTGTGDWVELTYDVTEAQRIGIRAQYVYIDDFSADAIDTTPEAALVVSSVMNSDGQTGTNGTNPVFEQQPDGNMKVVLKVTLSNTGDVDFVAGTTENYTLTAAQTSYTSGTKTYYEDATVAIPEDLAAGETKTFDVEFTVPYISGYKYWYIKENVTGTTSSSYRYATSVAYASKFVLREAGSTSTSDLTTAQDYGRISAVETRSFEIYNDGTAPLTIMSITLPEGFTSDNLPEIPAEGLVLAKKTATIAFDVTLPITTTGDFSGNLSIQYQNVSGGNTETKTKTLPFSGTVLAEGTWFADFNGDKSSSSAGVYPEGSVVTSSTGLQFGYTGSYGSYDHYLKSYSSVGMLVMPKLTATAGAQLKYDAVKYQSGSSYYLKVYVSTDRKTWGEAKATINNSDLETSGQRYSQTLTFDEAGDYYVAFELLGVGLDNVIGLTKTAIAHDLYFKETSLVAEAQTGKEMKPSVKVIPLTAETAEGYTVKYYVDGVAVAEGTAVAMDASATSEKTFTINYTPNDEVTTEHDTYIAFEFADNTVIATEHQTLKVTNEPKFLFVAANTSVSQYTTNLTTAQAFGKVNVATESKNFKIYNQGTAPLNVTSIVAPEGFSVNKTEATIAAGESEDIVVTFSAETPGVYSGNLVVNYTQEGAQTYELAISGTMLDQAKWYANFDNASSSSVVWPAGLVCESGISTSYSGYGPYNCFVYTSASTETNNKLITPLLSANAGDNFYFDVKQYSSWGSRKVYVYLSTDRENWGEPIYTNESITSSNFETVEVTIPEAGNYYVGIAMTGIYVDELYGLTPVAVAHDWKMASSNVPAEGMQNVTYSASVNILNLGLADEAADSYTVTAYVDDEAVATGEAVAIPMSHKLSDTGTQLSVSFVYPKAGEHSVYVEVKAGDYTVKTVAKTVTFAEEIAVSGVQVGTKTTTSSNVPFYTSWMDDSAGKSMSDFIYTPEQLAACGIGAGSKINSITFIGTPNGTKTINSLTTEVWVAQQAVSDFTAGSPDKENMTYVKLHDAESVTFTSGTAYEFKINFAEPIVYDGNSGIRIFTNINGNGQYQSINFDVDGNYQNAYYAHGTGSFSSKVGNPVAYFGLETSVATLAGSVKTSGREAIEGATVTLKAANGVEYSGTTDAEGNYSFNVIQAGLDFTATVTAENYLTKEFAYSLGGESKTLDVTLYKSFAIVGNFPGFNDYGTDFVMEQSAEDPNVFTLTVEDVELDAITYKYKLRADGVWDNDGIDGYELPQSGDNNWGFNLAGTYTLKFTANVSEHTLTLEPVFVLEKNASVIASIAEEANLGGVTIASERQIKAGWNAIYLPVYVSAEEVTALFGENAEIAYYAGDETNVSGGITVKFGKRGEGSIEAGVPYLLWSDNEVNGFELTGRVIASDKWSTTGTNYDFVGTYSSVIANEGDYFIQGGKFVKATSGNSILPFRSYLQLKGADTARSISFTFNGEVVDVTTAIETVATEAPATQEGIYNLNGQKVQQPTQRGLYIINGKKVMVK